MTTQESINTNDFLASFKKFMDKASAEESVKEPIFLALLRTHFGAEPAQLPTVKEEFEKAEHPNLHLAITTLLARDGWESQLLGFVAPNDQMGVKFSNLLNAQYGWESKEGPVEYSNIPLDDDRVLACVQAGLYLIRHGAESLALLVRGPHEWHTSGDVEVMAFERKTAEHFLSELRTTMRANNIYAATSSHFLSGSIRRSLYSFTDFRR